MTQSLHNQFNKQLNQKYRELKKQYIESYKDIKEKILSEYAKIEISNNMTEQEKISKSQKIILKIANIISNSIVNANKLAVNNINNQLNDFYKQNYNETIKQLKEKGIDGDRINNSETKEIIKDNPNPFNVIAINNLKDKAQIKRLAQTTLFNSILVGFSLNNIKNVYEKNLKSSINILTTQSTRIENMATYNALLSMQPIAEKNGYSIIKIWVSQEDKKVREAHSRADGQEVDIDKPFYVDNEKLMYPGDIVGSAGNIINCRCYMMFRLKKI